MNVLDGIIDGFSKIEVNDESVVRISMNTKIFRELRKDQKFLSAFDLVTKAKELSRGSMGLLYGAKIQIKNIEDIELEGARGTKVKVSVEDLCGFSLIQIKESKRDNKIKFKFLQQE